MTAENALDPPPLRRRSGRAPYPRIAAIVVGVVVAVAAIFAIGQIVLKHPAAADQAQAAGAQRSGAATAVQPPPAVSAKDTAQTTANLQAQQKAANAPALAAHPVQVASVSPPAGPAPSGPGVTRSRASTDLSAG